MKIAQTDDLQEVIDYIVRNDIPDKVIDLQGYTKYIKRDLEVKGITLTHGKIEWQRLDSPTNSVRLHGANNGLIDIKLATKNMGQPNRGHIELINTNNTIIQDVIIDGDNEGKSIFCKTKASETYIKNVDIIGKIAWGILFNDGLSEQIKYQNNYSYRVVDNIDYADELMGSGLYISNFKFGHEYSTRAGDGIEINCPDFGFKNIIVDDPLIRKTNKSSSNGIGIGFAKCDDVYVNRPVVMNTAHDAIHFEKGSGHYVTDALIDNCWRGYGVSHVKNSNYTGGICRNVGVFIASYSNMKYGTSDGIRFQNMEFDTCTENGLFLSNMKNSLFKNLVFKNYNGAINRNFVKLYQEIGSEESVRDSLFENIKFIKENDTANFSNAISLQHNGLGNQFVNITSEGFEEKIKMELNGNIVAI